MSNFHLFSVGVLGFVGFVVNLLNRPTDSTTGQGQESAAEKVLPKKSFFSSALRVRKITFFIKGA
jgi:hypothetical protein